MLMVDDEAGADWDMPLVEIIGPLVGVGVIEAKARMDKFGHEAKAKLVLRN